MTKLVIFDLDGTLLNTIGDLAASCNSVLSKRGLPQHDNEQYYKFIGKGVRNLVKLAIPENLRSETFNNELYLEFMEYYTANMATHTVPYSGIKELLTELSKRENISLAVASNKFQDGAVMLVDYFFKDINFAVVFGNRDGVALKPDPVIVNDILQLTSNSASDTLYVGDSGVDMSTAKHANVRSVGVTWGFRDKAELLEHGACHIVDSPLEILDLL